MPKEKIQLTLDELKTLIQKHTTKVAIAKALKVHYLTFTKWVKRDPARQSLFETTEIKSVSMPEKGEDTEKAKEKIFQSLRKKAKTVEQLSVETGIADYGVIESILEALIQDGCIEKTVFNKTIFFEERLRKPITPDISPYITTAIFRKKHLFRQIKEYVQEKEPSVTSDEVFNEINKLIDSGLVFPSVNSVGLTAYFDAPIEKDFYLTGDGIGFRKPESQTSIQKVQIPEKTTPVKAVLVSDNRLNDALNFKRKPNDSNHHFKIPIGAGEISISIDVNICDVPAEYRKIVFNMLDSIKAVEGVFSLQK